MKNFIAEYCDVVFLNEEEAKAITGSEEATDAIEALKGMCETIVVKLGKKGAVVYSKGELAKTGVKLVNRLILLGQEILLQQGFCMGSPMGIHWSNQYVWRPMLLLKPLFKLGLLFESPIDYKRCSGSAQCTLDAYWTTMGFRDWFAGCLQRMNFNPCRETYLVAFGIKESADTA